MAAILSAILNFWLDNDIFQNSWAFLAYMPNFMLVSLNARFLLKIDLICLAIINTLMLVGSSMSSGMIIMQ